ncbi:MAG TPA: OpgC domain-containing protein [Opitutaceae bacterium]|nr:OpgC domain-containing protein [Opitutaceae bacterium]
MIHVDALRGLLLVFMAVNHIPSSLQVVTNHFFGFVSGAEGFVFLSGLMCGLVYSRRYYKFGASEMKDAALRRASAVYLYHVVTFIAVLGGLKLFTVLTGKVSAAATPLLVTHPFASLVSGLVLMQQPSLFDILPMYCAFLLILPWVIVACARDNGKGVLVGSGIVWALALVFSPQQPLIRGLVNTGSFNLLAWQLLFMVGAVFGHAWAANRPLLSRPRAAVLIPCFLAAAFLFCVRHAWIHLPMRPALLDWLTNKNNMAPLRLFNTALLFYLVYALVSRAPQWFSWRPLAFLGRHSIFVFAGHILVAYSIQSYPAFFDGSVFGRACSTAIMIVALFVAAAIHESWQKRAKRRDEELRARHGHQPSPTIGYGTRSVGPTNPFRHGGG